MEGFGIGQIFSDAALLPSDALHGLVSALTAAAASAAAAATDDELAAVSSDERRVLCLQLLFEVRPPYKEDMLVRCVRALCL